MRGPNLRRAVLASPCFALLALAVADAAEPVAAPAPASSPVDSRTEETRRVATAFLTRMFDKGDVRGAYDSFAAPDFIQHNPNMADGLAGHRAYFAKLAARSGPPASWANINNMLIVDGDLFALHHHGFTKAGDPGRVFVDIWRVSGGRIVEHWDVIQAIPPAIPHGNGVGCGVGDDHASASAYRGSVTQPTCGLPDAGIDRAQTIAQLDAYTEALSKGDVEAAIRRWFTPDYRQHSPEIPDGVDGAIDYLRAEFGKGAAAMPKFGQMRTLVDHDFVLKHRLTTYADGRRTANVDIFRFRDGRISEHWDVRQDVPATSENANGMS